MDKMEESQPHLQIFNNIWKNAPRKQSGFACFASLPTELRQQIWLCSLQRERMIRVAMRPSTRDQATTFILRSTDTPYVAVVEGHQTLSKLLRVNREARQAALRFYRVHFPCMLRDEHTGKKQEKATFYFNPEYDFLQIAPSFSKFEDMVDIFYHLKHTYDPRRVGVLNLAIRSTDPPDITNIRFLTPAYFSTYYRDSFLETMAQLREVFFIQNVAEGRHILGTWSGMPSNDFILNRSMPIATCTPTFDRLHRDPRPVAGDLKQTYVKKSPVGWFRFWQHHLDKWDISPTQIKYHYALSFTPEPFTHVPCQFAIYDTEQAKEWLQTEEYEWTGKWRVDDDDDDDESFWGIRTTSNGRTYKYPVGALHERYRHEDLEKAVKPAFGFWLFPVCPDKSGRLPSSYGDSHPSLEELVDLSGIWPGIGLMELP